MKETYAYTTGTLGTLQSRLNYGYGNSNWKDQLTSYNGTSITYDLSGNPLKWRNEFVKSDTQNHKAADEIRLRLCLCFIR